MQKEHEQKRTTLEKKIEAAEEKTGEAAGGNESEIPRGERKAKHKTMMKTIKVNFNSMGAEKKRISKDARESLDKKGQKFNVGLI